MPTPFKDTPEGAIVIAILRQAVTDVQGKKSDVTAQEKEEALYWIYNDPQCQEMCDWLDINHTALIEALEKPIVSSRPIKITY